jgi:hypothetical protein
VAPGDVAFLAIWFAFLGSFGVLFALFPYTVIRFWARVCQKLYAAYGPILQSIERWPVLGPANRRLMGMPAEAYVQDALRDPGVSPPLVWYVRTLGAVPLAMVVVALVLLLIRAAR